jgi:hypothetical protein
LSARGGEAEFGEAQEAEAEESFRTGTLKIRSGNVGCRHCLPGGVPEALFQRGVAGGFFGCGDPVHAADSMLFQIISAANEKDDCQH